VKVTALARAYRDGYDLQGNVKGNECKHNYGGEPKKSPPPLAISRFITAPQASLAADQALEDLLLFLSNNADAQLAKLLGCRLAWRVHQQVLRLLVHRE